MRRRILYFLMFCAVPSLLLGQASGPALKKGDRVRITAQSDTGIYFVHAVSADTLTLELPSSPALAYFPVTTLRRVEISRGRDDPAERFVRRSLGGALIVGAVGGVFGMGIDPKNKGRGAAYGAAFSGAIGFGIGLVSALGHGERWERVALPPRVSVSEPNNGVFALSYSF